jgi:phage shock protein PspC (stress-responsive transcriptional regulator)
LVLLFGVAMFVVFAIVLPVWTDDDAKGNSPHGPLLWALVVFFGGVLCLLLYVISVAVAADEDGRPTESGPRRSSETCASGDDRHVSIGTAGTRVATRSL